jgi:hypothetical protein
MTVLDRLAVAMDRRDEQPNVALAEELARSGDHDAIVELVGTLKGGDKEVANDALKVLYELAERRPELIAPYARDFLDLLASRINRQVWGALQAIEAITEQRPDTVLDELPRIIEAADKGSVIAKDCCTTILVKLAAAGHAREAMPILMDRLKDAAPNQFPSYVEQAATVMTAEARPGFLALLRARLGKIVQKSKRDRVEKVIRTLNG